MPKFAANLTMLFNEVPFLDRFAAAADAGFNAVEFLFPYPYQIAELSERLQQNRLKLVLHNLPAGNWEAGERGIACLPDRVGEFQEGVGRAIEYAKRPEGAATELPRRHSDCGRRCGQGARDDRRQPALRRGRTEESRHQAAGRAVQFVRHPWLRAEPFGRRPRRDSRGGLGQSVPAIRHLSHATDGRRTRARRSRRICRRSRTSSSPTTRAATNRAPAKSTTRSCSTCSTRSATTGYVGCEYKPRTTTAAGLGWVQSVAGQTRGAAHAAA